MTILKRLREYYTTHDSDDPYYFDALDAEVRDLIAHIRELQKALAQEGERVRGLCVKVCTDAAEVMNEDSIVAYKFTQLDMALGFLGNAQAIRQLNIDPAKERDGEG